MRAWQEANESPSSDDSQERSLEWRHNGWQAAVIKTSDSPLLNTDMADGCRLRADCALTGFTVGNTGAMVFLLFFSSRLLFQVRL
jgi:hypothetical protein